MKNLKSHIYKLIFKVLLIIGIVLINLLSFQYVYSQAQHKSSKVKNNDSSSVKVKSMAPVLLDDPWESKKKEEQKQENEELKQEEDAKNAVMENKPTVKSNKTLKEDEKKENPISSKEVNEKNAKPSTAKQK